ncbi:MAG: hypothetical protein MZU84_05535 [Sphingobacterium sp.]|nr:hypothetical protein [Sphingobacterium sp.]
MREARARGRGAEGVHAAPDRAAPAGAGCSPTQLAQALEGVRQRAGGRAEPRRAVLPLPARPLRPAGQAGRPTTARAAAAAARRGARRNCRTGGKRHERRCNRDLPAARAAEDYKSAVKPIWCPGCGDFSVLSAITKALAHARHAAARGRRGLGHRLLVAHPGLHQLLRLPRRARPRARRRHRAEGGAARPDGARHRRRRRRLLDRRQPLPARLPAQRRPHLHRDGQPRLRHDQGPAVADHRARLGLEARARRHQASASSTRWWWRWRPARTSSRAGFSGDPNGIAQLLVEAIRHPGFALVQASSPCVTYCPEAKAAESGRSMAPGWSRPPNRPMPPGGCSPPTG